MANGDKLLPDYLRRRSAPQGGPGRSAAMQAVEQGLAEGAAQREAARVKAQSQRGFFSSFWGSIKPAIVEGDTGFAATAAELVGADEAAKGLRERQAAAEAKMSEIGATNWPGYLGAIAGRSVGQAFTVPGAISAATGGKLGELGLRAAAPQLARAMPNVARALAQGRNIPLLGKLGSAGTAEVVESQGYNPVYNVLTGKEAFPTNPFTDPGKFAEETAEGAIADYLGGAAFGLFGRGRRRPVPGQLALPPGQVPPAAPPAGPGPQAPGGGPAAPGPQPAPQGPQPRPQGPSTPPPQPAPQAPGIAQGPQTAGTKRGKKAAPTASVTPTVPTAPAAPPQPAPPPAPILRRDMSDRVTGPTGPVAPGIASFFESLGQEDVQIVRTSTGRGHAANLAKGRKYASGHEIVDEAGGSLAADFVLAVDTPEQRAKVNRIAKEHGIELHEHGAGSNKHFHAGLWNHGESFVVGSKGEVELRTPEAKALVNPRPRRKAGVAPATVNPADQIANQQKGQAAVAGVPPEQAASILETAETDPDQAAFLAAEAEAQAQADAQAQAEADAQTEMQVQAEAQAAEQAAQEAEAAPAQAEADIEQAAVETAQAKAEKAKQDAKLAAIRAQAQADKAAAEATAGQTEVQTEAAPIPAAAATPAPAAAPVPTPAKGKKAGGKKKSVAAAVAQEFTEDTGEETAPLEEVVAPVQPIDKGWIEVEKKGSKRSALKQEDISTYQQVMEGNGWGQLDPVTGDLVPISEEEVAGLDEAQRKELGIERTWTPSEADVAALNGIKGLKTKVGKLLKEGGSREEALDLIAEQETVKDFAGHENAAIADGFYSLARAWLDKTFPLPETPEGSINPDFVAEQEADPTPYLFGEMMSWAAFQKTADFQALTDQEWLAQYAATMNIPEAELTNLQAMLASAVSEDGLVDQLAFDNYFSELDAQSIKSSGFSLRNRPEAGTFIDNIEKALRSAWSGLNRIGISLPWSGNITRVLQLTSKWFSWKPALSGLSGQEVVQAAEAFQAISAKLEAGKKVTKKEYDAAFNLMKEIARDLQVIAGVKGGPATPIATFNPRTGRIELSKEATPFQLAHEMLHAEMLENATFHEAMAAWGQTIRPEEKLVIAQIVGAPVDQVFERLTGEGGFAPGNIELGQAVAAAEIFRPEEVMVNGLQALMLNPSALRQHAPQAYKGLLNVMKVLGDPQLQAVPRVAEAGRLIQLAMVATRAQVAMANQGGQLPSALATHIAQMTPSQNPTVSKWVFEPVIRQTLKEGSQAEETADLYVTMPELGLRIPMVEAVWDQVEAVAEGLNFTKEFAEANKADGGYEAIRFKPDMVLNAANLGYVNPLAHGAQVQQQRNGWRLLIQRPANAWAKLGAVQRLLDPNSRADLLRDNRYRYVGLANASAETYSTNVSNHLQNYLYGFDTVTRRAAVFSSTWLNRVMKGKFWTTFRGEQLEMDDTVALQMNQLAAMGRQRQSYLSDQELQQMVQAGQISQEAAEGYGFMREAYNGQRTLLAMHEVDRLLDLFGITGHSRRSLTPQLALLQAQQGQIQVMDAQGNFDPDRQAQFEEALQGWIDLFHDGWMPQTRSGKYFVQLRDWNGDLVAMASAPSKMQAAALRARMEADPRWAADISSGSVTVQTINNRVEQNMNRRLRERGLSQGAAERIGDLLDHFVGLHGAIDQTAINQIAEQIATQGYSPLLANYRQSLDLPGWELESPLARLEMTVRRTAQYVHGYEFRRELSQLRDQYAPAARRGQQQTPEQQRAAADIEAKYANTVELPDGFEMAADEALQNMGSDQSAREGWRALRNGVFHMTLGGLLNFRLPVLQAMHMLTVTMTELSAEGLALAQAAGRRISSTPQLVMSSTQDFIRNRNPQVTSQFWDAVGDGSIHTVGAKVTSGRRNQIADARRFWEQASQKYGADTTTGAFEWWEGMNGMFAQQSDIMRLGITYHSFYNQAIQAGVHPDLAHRTAIHHTNRTLDMRSSNRPTLAGQSGVSGAAFWQFRSFMMNQLRSFLIAGKRATNRTTNVTLPNPNWVPGNGQLEYISFDAERSGWPLAMAMSMTMIFQGLAGTAFLGMGNALLEYLFPSLRLKDRLEVWLKENLGNDAVASILTSGFANWAFHMDVSESGTLLLPNSSKTMAQAVIPVSLQVAWQRAGQLYGAVQQMRGAEEPQDEAMNGPQAALRAISPNWARHLEDTLAVGLNGWRIQNRAGAVIDKYDTWPERLQLMMGGWGYARRKASEEREAMATEAAANSRVNRRFADEWVRARYEGGTVSAEAVHWANINPSAGRRAIAASIERNYPEELDDEALVEKALGSDLGEKNPELALEKYGAIKSMLDSATIEALNEVEEDLQARVEARAFNPEEGTEEVTFEEGLDYGTDEEAE